MKFVARQELSRKNYFVLILMKLWLKHFYHLIHDAKRQARNSGLEFDLVKCVNTLLEDDSKNIRNPEILKLAFQTILDSGSEIAIKFSSGY